jgi:hypothetical protein
MIWSTRRHLIFDSYLQKISLRIYLQNLYHLLDLHLCFELNVVPLPLTLRGRAKDKDKSQDKIQVQIQKSLQDKTS